MKNVPLVVRRQDDQYTHTPLPTDGEVHILYIQCLYAPTVWLSSILLQSELNIVASFDRRGERIVTGSSKGKVQYAGVSTFLLPFSLYLSL